MSRPWPLLPDPPGGLPKAPHLPGSGTVPDMAPLDAAKALAPARTDPQAWGGNLAWRTGWTLFARGCFWEAHEVWEVVWLRCAPNSPERTLLRAVIQLANAHLKARMGRPRAVMRLLAQVAAALDDLSGPGRPACVMGVVLSDLHAERADLIRDTEI